MGGFFEGDADGLDEQAVAEADAEAAAAAGPMAAAGQAVYAWPGRGAAAPAAADGGRFGGLPGGRRRWELTRPPSLVEKKPYVNVDGVVSASELLSRRRRNMAVTTGVMVGDGVVHNPVVGGRGGVSSAGVASLPGSLAAGVGGGTSTKMTDKERRVLRRLRNRESAERCRLRAVGRADETRRAAAKLASENDRLAEEVDLLLAEVQALATDVVARGGSVRGIETGIGSG